MAGARAKDRRVMDATTRIIGWLFLAAVVFVILRGTAGVYLSYLGI
jgi:hypothetical protein